MARRARGFLSRETAPTTRSTGCPAPKHLEGHLIEGDSEFDEEPEHQLGRDLEEELDGSLDLEDRVGEVDESRDGNELVLSWRRRGSAEVTGLFTVPGEWRGVIR